MLHWTICDVRVIRIVEIESTGDSRFILPDATPEACVPVPWMQPHFCSPEGKLRMSVHALVNEVKQAIGTRRMDARGWPAAARSGASPGMGLLASRGRGRGRASPDHERLGAADRRCRPDGEVATNHRVCEQVQLEPTPGHTPGHVLGHVSVRITSGGHQALITGDFVHHPCQMQRLDWGSTADFDTAAAKATRERMLTRLAADQTLVIGTHFATPTAGRVKPRAEGGYWLDVALSSGRCALSCTASRRRRGGAGRHAQRQNAPHQRRAGAVACRPGAEGLRTMMAETPKRRPS